MAKSEFTLCTLQELPKRPAKARRFWLTQLINCFTLFLEPMRGQLDMINADLAQNLQTMKAMLERLLQMTDPEEMIRVREAWDNLASHSFVFAETREELENLRDITRHKNSELLRKIEEKLHRLVVV